MKTAAYIKLDTDVKFAAQKRAAQLGFSLSTLINAQLKQFIRAKEIVFQVFPDEQMSPELEKELARLDKDIKKNKNVSHRLTSQKKLVAHLRSL